jgi:SOS-response transcriptional repressor LexA
VTNTQSIAAVAKHIEAAKAAHDKTATVLDFIRAYIATSGIPPTLREIAAGCGISSTSVVSYHLGKLERDGAIKRMPEISRGIVLND